MTDTDRWTRAERLYHAALEHPQDEREEFLRTACEGDEALHGEVESLLRYDGRGEGLEEPAVDKAARRLAREADHSKTRRLSLTPGTRVGDYEIISPLGAGGMGEVHRARDTRLDREVAIKVLPAEALSDARRRARFVREARAASALNHPHIVTIHEIERDGEVDFIVMELVHGMTLAQRLSRGALSLDETLRIAIPFADALSAAHEAGVVHRDLKPANVMVTPEGRVKVLDFGLAKRVGDGDPEASGDGASAGSLSRTGRVMGTAGYISPEQARGHEVDSRTDIFSFGAVLYEMLTGHRAFKGTSSAETLAAVLKEQPKAPSELVPEVPKELERIVLRCLRKEPERRFQHASDLKIELQEVKEESDSQAQPAGAATALHRRRRRWIAGMAIGVALLATAVTATLWRLRTAAPSESPTAVPLTSLPGVEIHPALSPDAERVAFVWDGPERSDFDVYVKEIGSGEMVRVTTDPAADYHPVWSPHGTHLAFLRRQGAGARVILVPAAGGEERELALVSALPRLYQQDLWSFWLDWSPDGRFLAVTERGADGQSWGIVLVSVETGEKRALTTTGNPRIIDRLSAFSPDGRTLAFLRGSFAPEAGLFLLPLTSDGTPAGPAHAVGPERAFSTVARLCWLPGGHELVVGDLRVALDESSTRSFRLPSRSSDPQAAYTPGQASVRGPRLVFSTPERRMHLLRVPLDAGPNASIGAFFPSTRGEVHVAFRPDGRKVAFCSRRSGDGQVWVCNVDGSGCHELPLPEGSTYACSPSWSPDGQRLVLDASLGERFHLYVSAPDGSTMRRLTSMRTYDARARWSRDGRSIYHTSARSGDYQIWKTRVDVPDADAAAVQVTRHGGIEAEESLDGRYLYYAKRHTSGVWRLPLEGNAAGREERFLDIGGEGRWCLGSQGIYVLDDRTGSPPAIRFVDLATQRTSEVRALPPEWDFTEWGGAFAVSPDGGWAVVTVERLVESDLMLVEGFR